MVSSAVMEWSAVNYSAGEVVGRGCVHARQRPRGSHPRPARVADLVHRRSGEGLRQKPSAADMLPFFSANVNETDWSVRSTPLCLARRLRAQGSADRERAANSEKRHALHLLMCRSGPPRRCIQRGSGQYR
jgi:hypothetical protein